MSLIEGVGDEVTILVTIVVAVTTIVAAWFSTSVQEQQSLWQDIPGSVVDPDPLSQESSSSGDGDDTPELRGNESTDGATNMGMDQVRESSCVGATALPPDEKGLSVQNIGACHDTEEDSAAVQERCSVMKGDTVSQSSSFESIEAAFVTQEAQSDSNNASTMKNHEYQDISDSTDGNIENVDKSPDDIAHGKGEKNKEEQCVRRRQVPSSEVTINKTAQRTTINPAPCLRESSQSGGAAQAETNSTNSSCQSGGASQGGVRRNSQTPQQTRDQTASGVISIKLRFLDETERIVSTNMDDTLGNFRRETFMTEIQSGQTVRFISNGQVLSDDSRTLASYGIANNQVVICQISSAGATRGNHHHPSNGHQGSTSEPGDGDFDLGRYMVPLFACILAFVWYLRFQYRYMFNATSTLSLTAVTAVFILALLAVWRS